MKNENVYRARQNRKKWARDADAVRAGYADRVSQRERLLKGSAPTFTMSDGRTYKGRLNYGFGSGSLPTVRLN